MLVLSAKRFKVVRSGGGKIGFRLSRFELCGLSLLSPSPSLLLVRSRVQYSGKNISPSSLDILRTPIGCCIEATEAGSYSLPLFISEWRTRLFRNDEARFAHGSSYVEARNGVEAMRTGRDAGSSIRPPLRTAMIVGLESLAEIYLVLVVKVRRVLG